MWILHPQESCKVLIKQNEDVRFYERIKKYREKKENASVGYKNLKKYSRHVSYPLLRRPPLHRGGHTLEQLGQVSDTLPEKVILQRKSFGKGINPDMTEGTVAATTINASHQTSWLHLCGEDLWIVLSWLPQLTRDLGRCMMGQALR